MDWILLVHAGAWDIPEALRERHAQAVEAAVRHAGNLLKAGKSAIDAVVEAVAYLEDIPEINAGRGGSITNRGEVEMDAAVMDGNTLQVGAAAYIKHVRNPVRLARRIMESSPHILLVGEGAEEMALQWRLEMQPNEYFITDHELKNWRNRVMGTDTVGAVALDGQGHIAVAASTGGTPFKWSGRVGDTPLPGCGYYADDRAGAVVCTGQGEAIMRTVMAFRAMYLLQSQGDPQWAADTALDYLIQTTGGKAGLLVLSPDGRWGVAYNTDHFPRAVWASDMKEPHVWLTETPFNPSSL